MEDEAHVVNWPTAGGEGGGRQDRPPNTHLASRGVTETFHLVTKVE